MMRLKGKKAPSDKTVAIEGLRRGNNRLFYIDSLTEYTLAHQSGSNRPFVINPSVRICTVFGLFYVNQIPRKTKCLSAQKLNIVLY